MCRTLYITWGVPGYYWNSHLCPFFVQSLGAEKDNLDIVQHDWALPKFEQRAEAVLRKLVSWFYMLLSLSPHLCSFPRFATECQLDYNKEASCLSKCRHRASDFTRQISVSFIEKIAFTPRIAKWQFTQLLYASGFDHFCWSHLSIVLFEDCIYTKRYSFASI